MSMDEYGRSGIEGRRLVPESQTDDQRTQEHRGGDYGRLIPFQRDVQFYRDRRRVMER